MEQHLLLLGREGKSFYQVKSSDCVQLGSCPDLSGGPEGGQILQLFLGKAEPQSVERLSLNAAAGLNQNVMAVYKDGSVLVDLTDTRQRR